MLYPAEIVWFRNETVDVLITFDSITADSAMLADLSYCPNIVDHSDYFLIAYITTLRTSVPIWKDLLHKRRFEYIIYLDINGADTALFQLRTGIQSYMLVYDSGIG
jgi:hypothetical protein